MSKQIVFRKIELAGFGKLGNDAPFELAFAPGLNAIAGPNEAGKSTLQRALFAMLFGIYDAKERERWRPWNPRCGFGGALEFAADEKYYRVTQDFDKALASLERWENGAAAGTLFNGSIGKLDSRGEAQSWRVALCGAVGSAPEEFLRNANFIGQSMLDVNLQGEVERVISGLGRGGMETVRGKLYEQYCELTPRNSFTNRPLKDHAIELLEKRLEGNRLRFARIEQTAREHGELTEKRGELERELAANGRELGEAQARYEVLDGVYQASQRIEQCLQKIQALRGERERRESLEIKITKLQERLEREFSAVCNAPEDLDEKIGAIGELRRQAEFFEQAQADWDAGQRRLQEERAQLARELEQRFAEFDGLPPEFLERVERLQELRNALEGDQAQSMQFEASLAMAKAKSRRWMFAGICCACIAVVTTAIWLLSGLTEQFGTAIHFCVLAVWILCCVPAIQFLRLRGKVNRIGEDARAAQSRIEPVQSQLGAFPREYEKFCGRDRSAIAADWARYGELRKQLEKLDIRLEEKNEGLPDKLQRAKRELEIAREQTANFIVDGDTELTRRMLREFRQLERDIETNRDALKSHRGAEAVDAELNRQQTEYDRRSSALEEILAKNPDALPFRDHPAELADRLKELREQAEHLTQRMQSCTEQRMKALEQLTQIRSDDHEGLAVLRERILEDEAQLSKMKARCAALELAIRTIDECKEEFGRLHLQRLAEKSAAHFRAITREAYAGLRIGADFDLRLSNAARAEIGAGELSQGARDQLYLALRFALARELAGDAAWPLLLDDPFVNCDAMRLAEIRRALDELSREHQIILFSAQEQYADWGRLVQIR